MKLSELMHLLQRYHDLYPQADPEILMTLVDYPYDDTEKEDPEYTLHTLDVKMFETRTLVHIPSESLFSERGPYLSIYYEREYIENVEQFWHNTYFQQHGQKQTGSVNSRSSSVPEESGADVGSKSVSTAA